MEFPSRPHLYTKYTEMEISIKKPCNENWATMTPNEQGAFCSSCAKTVVDFSKMSLDEIQLFFTLRSKERICGRFEDHQLSSLSFESYFNSFKSFHLTKRIAVIVFFTFGSWLFNSSSAFAQHSPVLKGDEEVNSSPIMGGVRVMPQINDSLRRSPKVVKGKVSVRQKPRENYKLGEVIAQPPPQSTSPSKLDSTKPRK
ncbi:MAG: hypothetical protein K0R26_1533 [Bacteroidota bacterium]|jgi:hypothetical protein|nr:hypothetical protein [Bacteroidota bacterium]